MARFETPLELIVEAHVKDRAETAAHRAVCAGRLTLGAAQEQMRQWRRP
jgi:hypothetical protein